MIKRTRRRRRPRRIPTFVQIWTRHGRLYYRVAGSLPVKKVGAFLIGVAGVLLWLGSQPGGPSMLA